MARGNKQSKTGKGEHKTYKGVVANPKYGVRNRTTYTEKTFKKVARELTILRLMATWLQMNLNNKLKTGRKHTV